MQQDEYFNLSSNTEDAIKTLLAKIINETGNIDEEGVFIELKELLDEAKAKNTVKETSDTIRFIINQILKKGLTPEILFSRKLKLAENYTEFIKHLGMLNKARKDINNVVDQLYDHINLKLSYATSIKRSFLGRSQTVYNNSQPGINIPNNLDPFNTEPNNLSNSASIRTVGNNNRSANFSNRIPIFRERERPRNPAVRNRRNQTVGYRNRNRNRNKNSKS